MERVIQFFGEETFYNEEQVEMTSSEGPTLFGSPIDLLKSKIDLFVGLENNWDGYGGVPLLKSIANKAKSFIPLLSGDLIDKISDIFPNNHGTITIEWENKKEKLSLEIGETNYSYFVKYNDGKAPKFVRGNDIVSDLQNFAQTLGLFCSE